jgi:hypothetical protein
MIDLAKLLIATGLVLLVAGAVVWGLNRFGFRGLPGDIRYESENFRFYFPIVTCLAISAIVTLLIQLWRWIMRK